MSLSIGDVIVVKKNFKEDGEKFIKGNIGKVVNIIYNKIGVEWTFTKCSFHDCHGKGKDGYCYYVNYSKERFDMLGKTLSNLYDSF